MSDELSTVWAFVLADDGTGRPGIPSVTTPALGTMPLITTRETNLEGMRDLASAAARLAGTTVSLRRYEQVSEESVR